MKILKIILKIMTFTILYKELLNFCTVDLSAFYFDIRKDSLYCDSKDSKKRQSTIILLNVILKSLLRWFAPILIIYNRGNL
jgi:isoleucyl-tRNA synthetase